MPDAVLALKEDLHLIQSQRQQGYVNKSQGTNCATALPPSIETHIRCSCGQSGRLSTTASKAGTTKDGLDPLVTTLMPQRQASLHMQSRRRGPVSAIETNRGSAKWARPTYFRLFIAARMQARWYMKGHENKVVCVHRYLHGKAIQSKLTRGPGKQTHLHDNGTFQCKTLRMCQNCNHHGSELSHRACLSSLPRQSARSRRLVR